MGESILSQDEISALLSMANNTSGNYDELQRFFEPVMPGMRRNLESIVRQYVTVEGPLVESIPRQLSEAFFQNTLVVPAEIGDQDLFFFLSELDSHVWSSSLRLDTFLAMDHLCQSFLGSLTERLARTTGHKVETNLYQPTLMSKEQIATLPPIDNSYLLRSSIGWKNHGIELITLVTTSIMTARSRFDGHRSTAVKNRASGFQVLRGGQGEVGVEKPIFQELPAGNTVQSQQDIDLINDVYLAVVGELGRTTMTLGEVMDLQAKSVISLDKLAGEPLDVFVNGNQIAKAEVMVLDTNFGIRILDIVPADQRIHSK